jgi:hypothetical protein
MVVIDNTGKYDSWLATLLILTRSDAFGTQIQILPSRLFGRSLSFDLL